MYFRQVGVVSLQSADHANLGDSSARGWRRSSGLAWNGLLPFGEYMASSVLLRLPSPRFQNFGYFPRARPPFVFHFTATSIPFSYCLTRARSPV